MKLSIRIAFSQQKNNLLSREILFLKARFSSVKVVDLVAFFKSPFERLEHEGLDAPVLISNNTAGDLSLLDANVSDNGDGFVIVSQIAQ